MQKPHLVTIFVVVFIDLLGFGLILPLLPYYAETFDASSTMVGLFMATYSAAQLIGAPVLGRLSDRFGRRPIMLVSIGGTFIGFVLLGVANTLWLLFVSRLIDGTTGGNISVARAYIADVTDEKNRARGMGLIGAAFGLGFVFGPALGGFLSTGERYALPAFVAAGLSLCNFVAVYVWLPESLDATRRAQIKANKESSFSWSALRRMVSHPGVGPLLRISFVFGLAFAMFEGVFSLYAQKHLELASNQTGYLLAYVGVLVAFVQGGAIGRLSHRFREEQLILGAAAILVPSLIGWAYAPTTWIVVVALAPLSLSIGVLSATVPSLLTMRVQHQQVGGVLGVASAIGSITRIIGPILGAALLDFVGTWSPGMVAALLIGWLLFYAWRYFSQRSDPVIIAAIEHERSRI